MKNGPSIHPQKWILGHTVLWFDLQRHNQSVISILIKKKKPKWQIQRQIALVNPGVWNGEKSLQSRDKKKYKKEKKKKKKEKKKNSREALWCIWILDFDSKLK